MGHETLQGVMCLVQQIGVIPLTTSTANAVAFYKDVYFASEKSHHSGRTKLLRNANQRTIRRNSEVKSPQVTRKQKCRRYEETFVFQ
jgi:hypothetical protein